MNTSAPRGSPPRGETRLSLLDRLRDAENREAWLEFFESYWGLLYDFSCRAGLSDADAQDVVQETVISVAKKMPEFQYDPSVCSFKSWLFHVARKRVADHFRRAGRRVVILDQPNTDDRETALIDRLPHPTDSDLDQAWDAEWAGHSVLIALERIKDRLKPKHFQIYYLQVVREQSVREVARALGVSPAYVYLTKHRVSRQVRKELRRLNAVPRQRRADGARSTKPSRAHKPQPIN